MSTPIRVYCNEETYKTLAITDSTTAEELCVSFAKKMGLKTNTTKNFQISVYFNDLEVAVLQGADLPMDSYRIYASGRDIGWGNKKGNCFLFQLNQQSADKLRARMTMSGLDASQYLPPSMIESNTAPSPFARVPPPPPPSRAKRGTVSQGSAGDATTAPFAYPIPPTLQKKAPPMSEEQTAPSSPPVARAPPPPARASRPAPTPVRTSYEEETYDESPPAPPPPPILKPKTTAKPTAKPTAKTGALVPKAPPIVKPAATTTTTTTDPSSPTATKPAAKAPAKPAGAKPTPTGAKPAGAKAPPSAGAKLTPQSPSAAAGGKKAAAARPLPKVAAKPAASSPQPDEDFDNLEKELADSLAQFDVNVDAGYDSQPSYDEFIGNTTTTTTTEEVDDDFDDLLDVLQQLAR